MKNHLRIRPLSVLLTLLLALVAWGGSASAADLQLLFFGDNGHHQPMRRFFELSPALKDRGVQLKYTDRMQDLNTATLAKFDGVVLYANIDRIEDDQAAALLQFVREGGGFIPLHCATYCWRNNPEIVALMGGQFQRHGTGTFSTQIAQPNHPVMQGYGSFTSWDETYIHHLHNEKDRTVLEYRLEGEQAEGSRREPWTWVRTHGEGRVFYTAWGHDARTFTNPGFHNLVERGIRWACGDDPGVVPSFQEPMRFEAPETTAPRTDVAEFNYIDVGPKIPNYTPSRSWGAQGDPKTLMQKPLPANESVKHFVTPVNMQVQLYADERNFQAKPIAMTWDERGRLWVCETVDYPNEEGGNRDRIRICEDTNGDHRADKFTVFADGLSIPAAIVIVRGGAVVQNGRTTVYLKDTNGDDVADESTTLITGWGLGDTHGGVSNFRYGLDNWIWAMQGYNYSSPRYDSTQAQSFSQGFWRFRLSSTDPPRVTDLEFVRSSDNNTWGLGISEEGLIFGSTANRNPSMFMTIPNRYYEQVRGWAPKTLHSIADTHLFSPVTDNVRQVDQHGGYTAAAGHALYTARAFPSQWWNSTAFVCGPTGHLVGTFALRPQGANFTSTSPVNLLASDDEWTAPIMAEVGPDGAVWVIDWYNYIVQHNPTPHGFETGKGAAYESDLRDKTHGRIYRVVAQRDGQPSLHTVTSLTELSNQELVSQLTHPSFRHRLHAQRLLLERNAVDATDALFALLNDESVDEANLNVGAIHALHTLHALGQLGSNTPAGDPAVNAFKQGLGHPSAGVRRNAVAVLPLNQIGLSLLLDHKQLFTDANAQVRLRAVLTLADMESSTEAGQLIARLAARETDPVLVDALTSAAAAHGVPFLREITQLQQERDAVNQIAGRVAEHLARGGLSSADLSLVVSGLRAAPVSVSGAVIEGLTRGLPAESSIAADKSLNDAMVGLFQDADGAMQGKLLQFAGRAGISALDRFAEQVISRLTETLENTEAAAAERGAAAENLLSLRPGNADFVDLIVGQITPQTPLDAASQLLESLDVSEAEQGGEILVDYAASMTPTTRTLATRIILSKPQWVRSLLAAADSGDFDLNDLPLEQKQALRSFPKQDLREKAEVLLARSGSLPDADRAKVLESLIHVTQQKGNTKAGRAVFKETCAVCHQHGDMGNQIGPNLTGMAVHPKTELLTHIIDPSRNVEGNFRMYSVVTTDGKVLNGMLAGESRTSISLIDSKGKKADVPREEIEELISSRESVMPEGFEKQLSEEQLTDLLEFLTDKGPYIPLVLDQVATVVSTQGLFGGGDTGPDRMIFSDWKPKVFSGVPFVVTNPQGKSTPNMILLHGPNSPDSARMPKSVSLPCRSAAAAIHFLSGVGGWNYPYSNARTVSMIVRLHYADGSVEDHPLLNGVHFADYIRRADVPGSEFAFALGNQQLRYLRITPQRSDVVESVELVKGEDNSAPMVMAVTVQIPDESR